uniref:Uncharacterized protein n=1 Tax=Anguilla anguilla TaxID=7936 RepID=A0A0E9PQW2_ANGAN
MTDIVRGTSERLKIRMGVWKKKTITLQKLYMRCVSSLQVLSDIYKLYHSLVEQGN